MAEETQKPAETTSTSTSKAAGADEVQKKRDVETKQGFVGEVPDKTPNEAYTLQGQAEGKQPEQNRDGERIVK